jgi:hypothetical protein
MPLVSNVHAIHRPATCYPTGVLANDAVDR